jgi:hypothetical protein
MVRALRLRLNLIRLKAGVKRTCQPKAAVASLDLDTGRHRLPALPVSVARPSGGYRNCRLIANRRRLRARFGGLLSDVSSRIQADLPPPRLGPGLSHSVVDQGYKQGTSIHGRLWAKRFLEHNEYRLAEHAGGPIIQRNYFDIAHAARFLPNSVVRWLQLGGWNFPQARDLYRLLFGMLLFYSIYRYARVFTGHVGAIVAVLLTAAVYPISFQNYVGQLTDPMSHLSFVLAFLFIEREDFPFLLFLLTSLVIVLRPERQAVPNEGCRAPGMLCLCLSGSPHVPAGWAHGIPGYQRRYH